MKLNEQIFRIKEMMGFVETTYGSDENMGEKLKSIRSKLILAAQKIYNDWEQDDDGYDDIYGSGGICDDIADAMCDVINKETPYGCFTLYNEHDCHTSIYVYNVDDKLLYNVDMPPYVYETGTAYTWRKIKNVEFDVKHISIDELNYDDYLDENGEILFNT